MIEELDIKTPSENCLNRFLMREKIIDHIRQNGDLSDSELGFAVKEYPQIVLDNLNPTPRVALAYIKAGNPLDAHTFPDTVWNDKEVLYQAFCTRKFLHSAANKKIDESIYKRFVEEHSDLEIATFFQRRPYLLDDIKNNTKDKSIIKRIAKVNEQNLNHIDEEYLEEPLLDCTALEKVNYKKANYRVNYKSIDLSGNIDLIKEKLPSPKYVDIDMQSYSDSVYPRLFHYISDLHLTHKIKREIEKGTPVEAAVKYVVRKAVKDIEKSMSSYKDRLNSHWESQILMICGDVTFDFNIAKAFYKELSNSLIIKKSNTYVTLGNHELWDGDPNGERNHNCDSVIEKYRKLIESYGFTFLENQVAVVLSDNPFTNGEKYVLDADFIFDDNNQEAITLLFLKSRYIICGGIGFSGNNESFNVENGIYRKTIKSRDEEIKRSQVYDALFWRVKRLAKGKTIISLTHMPKEDWSHILESDNCIFISGHTHRNYRSEEGTRVFADNQIGYKSNEYYTKQFSIDTSYDIFESYPDGIHKIERIDYSEFGKGIGLHLSFRHDPYSQLYLLKRDGIYMFISESNNGLSILNGGRRTKLKRKDLNYYFSNMAAYAELLKSSFEGYEEYIGNISKEIRKLGGSGRIHGCIVDVDSLNHIYVNPYDGKITYYFATNILSRIGFSDFVEMLECNISRSETINIIKNNYLLSNNIQQLTPLDNSLVISSNTFVSTGTFIYKPSMQVNKIHKLFNYKVLQFWEESD